MCICSMQILYHFMSENGASEDFDYLWGSPRTYSPQILREDCSVILVHLRKINILRKIQSESSF